MTRTTTSWTALALLLVALPGAATALSGNSYDAGLGSETVTYRGPPTCPLIVPSPPYLNAGCVGEWADWVRDQLPPGPAAPS